ncbi:hypothetical protein DF3PA_70112 [Candidatus Defluviicoccus seviourii]|uniref:Uncharacterized protein n=1 Tax=Candidatus Defluviicoccus seviourii TaxID=2565273 RepID=A0A564WHL0_9PROT|nr:hypothetical protein DF3PA_70112 [Candidatus Defluviicoccus seviourii]
MITIKSKQEVTDAIYSLFQELSQWKRPFEGIPYDFVTAVRAEYEARRKEKIRNKLKSLEEDC